MYFNRGYELLMKNEAAQAEQFFRTALDLMPDRPRRLYLAPGSCGSESTPRGLVLASNLRDGVPLARAGSSPSEAAH